VYDCTMADTSVRLLAVTLSATTVDAQKVLPKTAPAFERLFPDP
jgi:hypothetical protein